MRESDLATVIDLADAADRMTMARYGAADLQVRDKPDRSPVTEVDTAVEEALRRMLARACPADGIIGEEYGGENRPGRVWVIDPVDGTKNFLRGNPVWATLIALVEDGVPTLGMVSAPALQRRWWAARGRGAWTLDRGRVGRVRVSGVTRLADAYLSTTSLGTWTRFHSRAAYLRLVDACWENRAFGDFWQHCLVAEGVVDLAAEPIVGFWDIAALKVLVEEAGGDFTDLSGRRDAGITSVLASNGRVHAAAMALLAPGTG
uniref:Histidinol-phosphatase n=3 Tax=Marinactinospora thermotolerans TaxID=531310 RepID=G8HX54_9ACTN|nr:inositol-phosphate phosphatase [Marinactinospora thermotolerans]